MVFFTDVQSRINWRRRPLKAWKKMKTWSVTCMEDEFKDQSVTGLMTKSPRRRLSPTAPATLVGAPSSHAIEVIYNTSDPRQMKRCRQGQECEVFTYIFTIRADGGVGKRLEGLLQTKNRSRRGNFPSEASCDIEPCSLDALLVCCTAKDGSIVCGWHDTQ